MNYSIDNLHVYTLNVGYAQHNSDWNWKNVRRTSILQLLRTIQVCKLVGTTV